MNYYTTSFTATARSAWSTWNICSARSCRDTARVWAWYHRTFLGADAVRRYEDVGRILGVVMVLAIGAGMIARIYVQGWVDAHVEAALPAAPIALLSPAPEPMPEADPFGPYVPAVAAAMAPPVAVMTIPVLDSLNSQQLRKQCQESGVKWRNAHGQGRHLSKAEMLEALR